MDLLPTELRFAQQLASNEKRIRDKSLKKLRKFLQAKSASKKTGFVHEDFQRIWKGLHYCMWMQDKPVVQEDLAEKISQLVHDLGKAESKRLFVKVFIQTEAREWNGIDIWRVDKFMMLFRCMLTQALMVVKKQNWKKKSVEGMVGVFGETLLNAKEDGVPFGLRAHFIDIYLDELHKVGGGKINSKLFLQLIDPFFKFLQQTRDPDSVGRIVSQIFEPIIERTAHLCHSEKNEESSAGEIAFPNFKIDASVIADYMFELGKDESTPAKQRETFYSIVKRLQNACEGILPNQLEMPTEHPIPKAMVGDAVGSLVDLEFELNDKPSKKELKSLKKKQKALLKMKGKENSIDVLTGPVNSTPEASEAVVGKKRKHAETDIKTEEPFTKMKRKSTEQSDVSSAKKTVKGPLKSKGWCVSVDNENDGQAMKTESQDSEVSDEKKTLSEDNITEMQAKGAAGKNKKKTPKRKSLKGSSQEDNGGNNIRKGSVEDTPNKGNKKTAQKRKLVDVDCESAESNCDKSDHTEESPSNETLTNTSKQAKVGSKQLTVDIKPVKIQIQPSDDLEEGETEIFVPSKKYKGIAEMGPGKFADFESLKTPVAYVKRIMAKTAHGTPALVKQMKGTPSSTGSTSGSAKRVKFNMKKNQSQSFKDSLKSPIVPFNPAKTPDQSILKPKTDSVSSQGALRMSTRKGSSETPTSTGSLKSLKTTKKTPKGTGTPKSTPKGTPTGTPKSSQNGTPKGTPTGSRERTPKGSSKAVKMDTPIMSLNAKLKRKVAADFFSL